MSRDWRTIPREEQEQIVAEAKKLVGYVPWGRIAEKFNITVDAVQSRLDPAYHDRRAMRRERDRKALYTGQFYHQVDYAPPPVDLAARLAEIPEDTRGFTARFCGDPIPGDGRRAAYRAGRGKNPLA